MLDAPDPTIMKMPNQVPTVSFATVTKNPSDQSPNPPRLAPTATIKGADTEKIYMELV